MRTERQRKSGESTKEWLLSSSQLNQSESFGLQDSLVSWDETWPYDVEPRTFDARRPPRILNSFFQGLNTAIESNWTCWVNPLQINAPMSLVWKEIVDFPAYTSWNPFHRQVKIVENSQGERYVRMWINYGASKAEGNLIPVEKSSPLSDEKLIYVDERERFCILIYALDWYFIPTMRCQVVEDRGDNTCTYYSYDHFGGWVPLALLKCTMQKLLQDNFTTAALALKARCESIIKEQGSSKSKM